MSDVVEQVIQRHPEVKNEGIPEGRHQAIDPEEQPKTIEPKMPMIPRTYSCRRNIMFFLPLLEELLIYFYMVWPMLLNHRRL